MCHDGTVCCNAAPTTSPANLAGKDQDVKSLVAFMHQCLLDKGISHLINRESPFCTKEQFDY
ncbi:putative phospholipid hydroperoxide glutathione peroxidase [Frankliniella fusca]|uniref:Phospholipid hydroperoxide glutathione peroxidase n=2 Tax=Frankliniella fusca TaxID=407009 RepID=A0AAE1GTN7_9NEOP|nr:putative phospholipid hydroperoxide glutathione peroxidase [Frankliniella fusca]